MPNPTLLLPLLNYQVGVLTTNGRPEEVTTQPVFKRPSVSQPIQSPSPKFEITGMHFPEQPWNTNSFAALEDDDDETVAASNVNKGYFDEDDIGMESGIPTK